MFFNIDHYIGYYPYINIYIYMISNIGWRVPTIIPIHLSIVSTYEC